MDEVERAFRDAHGRAVATLARLFGDLSLAEDAVQEAFAAALDAWPRQGIPANPAGWVVTTARRRAIDTIRRDSRGRELLEQAARAGVEPMEPADADGAGALARDDQLRLLFTCCHPALRVEHQVALTLRLIAGLDVAAVARGFLVPEPTMAKRLARAKRKIAQAGIPYRVPTEAELPARLRSVLTALSLVYNAGVDDRERGELRTEAIRVTRVLVSLMPDEPEASGLLALMLLSEARVPAQGGPADVVLLRDQDRSRWDRGLIEEGHALVRACLHRDRPGPFQVQAAIQAVHDDAARFGDTDWVQILQLYDQLLALTPTAVVALNRAIALAEVSGPQAALDALEPLAERLDGYHLFHAARADLLRRLGLGDESRRALDRAVALAPTDRERAFLTHRRP